MNPSVNGSFWVSSRDELLVNPRLPENEKRAFEAAWAGERGRVAGPPRSRGGRVALPTSGSAGALKLVLLSKAALLAAAAGANGHLRSDASDVWLKTLPDFHVGGLSIHARAFVSGASVVDIAGSSAGGWSPEKFLAALGASGATLTSLVPAQLFDLVSAGKRPPPALRAAVVGGGALAPALYARSRDLGWPVLPSYGLTECGSQVATATLESLSAAGVDPTLALLPHVEARETPEGRLELKSAALLEGYLWPSGEASRFEDPKTDGWFATEDRGRVDAVNRALTVAGRVGDFIKIGGESVDLSTLEAKFEAAKLSAPPPGKDVAILAVPDERLGAVIHLLHEGPETAAIRSLIAAFNAKVAPFERIRSASGVERIPRSGIGKLLRAAALAAFEAER